MGDGEEHSLQSYDVYKEYLALVEAKLEGFMSSEGLNPESFQERCQEAQEDDSAMDTYLSLIHI